MLSGSGSPNSPIEKELPMALGSLATSDSSWVRTLPKAEGSSSKSSSSPEEVACSAGGTFTEKLTSHRDCSRRFTTLAFGSLPGTGNKRREATWAAVRQPTLDASTLNHLPTALLQAARTSLAVNPSPTNQKSPERMASEKVVEVDVKVDVELGVVTVVVVAVLSVVVLTLVVVLLLVAVDVVVVCRFVIRVVDVELTDVVDDEESVVTVDVEVMLDAVVLEDVKELCDVLVLVELSVDKEVVV
mmetsp:Transcript_35282/g.82358  ORF Transcript_35282/g.82358 Transcript_35282/m.82358 type:complete len:244 (+) Transcript_35282:2385-3116(+)